AGREDPLLAMLKTDPTKKEPAEDVQIAGREHGVFEFDERGVLTRVWRVCKPGPIAFLGPDQVVVSGGRIILLNAKGRAIWQAFLKGTTNVQICHRLVSFGFSDSLPEDTDLDSVASLMHTLQSKDPWARCYAAHALGQRGEAALPAIADLLKALDDSDESVRSSSTDSLCQMTPAIVPHLAEALGSSNPRVRIGVTTALAAYGQDAAPAVPRLTKALKDADIGVRIQAARALGRIKAELNIVVPALIEAFQDSASLPHQYGTTRVCTTA